MKGEGEEALDTVVAPWYALPSSLLRSYSTRPCAPSSLSHRPYQLRSRRYSGLDAKPR